MISRERLRELALEIASSKAVTEVLRYAGKLEHEQAELDTQQAIKQFDRALAEVFPDAQA